MARRPTDIITRFVTEYAGLDEAQRNQVAAAIRGYQIGSGRTESITKAAPRRRTVTRTSTDTPQQATS